ncbi:ABC-type transporter Mla MlaB component [Kitasatospora sp. GP30]|uniref:STAS domain-containing protein n=1 Tax=Kitasatospora sp. GP30 TaxID=3035084 RepID=UPI000C7067FE|nr:STAS domain-containing protein [Kitasatospora sp. GP30]MDH6138578.1 ABC-type transporter Mla MlaB component [Kitasatospora sp. GP30]
METVEFTVGPLPPGAGPFLTGRLAALLADHPSAVVVRCEVSAVERPTPADLDHLARLRLTARRAGRELVLAGVPPRLRLLLELTGLAQVFGCSGVGAGQPHREPP